MGANSSTFFKWYQPLPSKPNLGRLPEDCAVLIVSYMEPTEICKLAKLNKAFRGASWSDFVWESKLPENYEDIFRQIFGGDVPASLRKRDVYTRLSGHNFFDGGTKKAWLDKRTGGVCLSIASKGLAITGINDRRHWSYIPTEESRFHTVAYLKQTWWFEASGEVEFPFPAGTYSLFFRLHLGKASKSFFGRRICNTEHVRGWDIKPLRFELSTSEGQHDASQCFLNDPGKWIHHYVGDFVVTDSGASTKVKFSMTQIDCTHTKGGLCLDSVQIYPKSLGERLRQF